MDTLELEHLRHTLAHLLASAVKEYYPHAKPTLGPAIDNGFYYDFDFSGGEKPGEKELKKIEQKMREMLKKWDAIKRDEVDEKTAKERFAKNEYKIELIDEIVARKEPLTLYHSKQGDEVLFTDLCRGGHSEHPAKEISGAAFVLDRVAGAYWRGDEANTMLTRIYGLAFPSKEELQAYITMREEAKKRDHRKFATELDLVTFSELVGPGLPLWTPRGTIVRRELDNFVQELRAKYHYTPVTIPHITRKALYETSGHWEKFADELFRVTTREGKEYALKPMNCPHHTQIFARKPHSYREMPQRYSETTMVYRDEQSGELGGLTRVLSITQDDSHVFCRPSQVKDEFMSIWDIVDTLYTTFHFKLRVRLSFHDPENFEAYIGTKEIWKQAEDALREIATEREANFFEAQGEAAMYGPKLDFMATDSLGREHQVATIQLDLNMPERFDLYCINEKGEKERVVMIHAAIMGSIERFSAVLLEHLNGILPLWLSPEQVRVLPVNSVHNDYAMTLVSKLTLVGVRAELDAGADSLGKRMRKTKLERIPAYIVVGDAEVESKKLNLERQDGTKITHAEEELVEALLTEIQKRKTA